MGDVTHNLATENVVHSADFLNLIKENQQIHAPDLSKNLYHAEIVALINHDWFTYDLRNISIREGLQFNISQVKSNRSYAFEMPLQYDVIGFTYGLKGHTFMKFKENRSIELPEGSSIVYRFGSEDQKGLKRYEKGEDIHFSIHFTLDTFRSMLDIPESQLPEAFRHFAYGNKSGIYQTIPINHEVDQILNELLNIDQVGLSRQFFVESKVLELISIQLEHLSGSSCAERSSPKEEKLQECRSILMDNFDQPPSLIDLTKQVGINLCDLKIGFKQMFGLPPYQYLKNYRLQRAHEMLNNGMTVNEVANRIGYASIGSFSNAFNEKFKRRPSSL